MDWHDFEQQKLAQQVVDLLTQVLTPEVSGVIISPEYAFETIIQKDHKTGLLLGLEKRAGSTDPLSLPQLIQNWGVEHVRNNYALAKLELAYHPQEPEAIRKKQLVAEIDHYCKMLDIDFFLELRIFSPKEELSEKAKLEEAQIMALEDMREMCDLISLEPPADTLSAVTLTAELDIPWVVTSRESQVPGSDQSSQNYENFKEKLRVSLESGARGFVVGDLLWRDIFASISHELRQSDQEKWFDEVKDLSKTKIRDRVIELVRITNESGL